MKKRILIVIDMQEDFIYGALGSEAARAIVPNIKEKIQNYIANGNEVIFTRDTHFNDYLETQEGKKLPVPHCIHATEGWEVISELDRPTCRHIDKVSFGTLAWQNVLNTVPSDVSIELCGVCTDICVVSNCLVLKTLYPEIPIVVDASCCAGTSYEAHAAALTHFLRNEGVGPEDWPAADIDYLIGQLQEATENLGGDY